MSTRGIIAVVEQGTWAGFEVRADAYPGWAGEELVRLLRAWGLAESIKRVRAGTFLKGHSERATAATHGARGDLEWLYTIEPEAMRVRVFCPGPRSAADAPGGFEHLRWREVARNDLSADGRLLPASLHVNARLPDSVFTEFEVLEGWPEDDRAAALRHDTRARIARDAAAAGFTVEGLADLLEHAVSEAIFHAPWTSPVSGRFFVKIGWYKDAFYLRVRLAGAELHYPATAWSRGAGKLLLFSPPDSVVELKLTPGALVGRLPEARKLEALFISALPSEGWFYALLDFLRARRVPDPRGQELINLATPAPLADDWRVFMHADGRVWSIRPSAGGWQLRLGAPDDDPVFKERKGTVAEMNALIAEQLADGFAEQKT